MDELILFLQYFVVYMSKLTSRDMEWYKKVTQLEKGRMLGQTGPFYIPLRNPPFSCSTLAMARIYGILTHLFFACISWRNYKSTKANIYEKIRLNNKVNEYVPVLGKMTRNWTQPFNVLDYLNARCHLFSFIFESFICK